ncbi:MAG TPA: hypothetical protein PLC76_01125 [Saprospiraceae bacterium]|jgi:hypothetical protein|nr:MAG: hypothetical protein HWD63_01840 [Candidatus Parvibacillus calidus]HRN32856.1 hypothetical protein [Saprospiraceae bacterium]HRP83295.1 hypothetical protein [Saprospiraceae bacterium]
MSNEVNIYEEIVKLNMRISCLESLLQHIIEINPYLEIPPKEEIDRIYSNAIQQVIDEVEAG